MTAQMHEKLIDEGNETSMAYCPPLPSDQPRIQRRLPEERDPNDYTSSTACWRRYQGSWSIQDGKFYLVKLIGAYKLVGDEPLFADWVTAILRIPQGQRLHYVHMGFGSIYEFEDHVKIINGQVVGRKTVDNRNRKFDEFGLAMESLPGSENQFPGDDDW
jgi:hypothetical protein